MTTRETLESRKRVGDCIGALLRDQPFFGAMALRLDIRPDLSRETIACDGKELRFNPTWVATSSADQIMTAVSRIVFACSLKHHTRRKDRDAGRWQAASQMVTHGMMRDCGFLLPPDAPIIEEDVSVEEAYEMLKEGDENDTQGTDGSGAEGDGRSDGEDDSGSNDETPRGTESDDGADTNGSGDETGDADGGNADENNGGADGEGEGEGSGSQEGNGDGDAGAAGEQQGATDDAESGSGNGATDAGATSDTGSSGASASFDPNGTGEVMDAKAQIGADDEQGEMFEFDYDAEEQEWDEAMHQAQAVAKAEGKLPGNVAAIIDGAHGSALDWRDALRQFMVDSMKEDYSWSKPNRRYLDAGLYLPGLHSEGCQTIVAMVDTSGSIYAHPQVLAAFWTQIRAIAEELRPERLIVLQVDAALRSVEEWGWQDLPDEIVAVGGGGTDFRPGFMYLEDENIEPTVCIYLTDMYCTDYPREPDFPVVWCNWAKELHPLYGEPWGTRLDMGLV